MDFVREKDNPIIPGLPNLALPIHTPDLWTYTSQAAGGQFRLYRGGTGVFFDNQATDDSEVSSSGFDAGFGALVHGGVTKYDQKAGSTTRKWKSQNAYLSKGDFQDALLSNPAAQHVFFRQVGEKNLEDKTLADQLSGTQPLEVNIGNAAASASFKVKGSLYGSTITAPVINKKDRRQSRTVISYLTATEAAQGGLYKTIDNYPFNDASSFQVPVGHKPVPDEKLDRVDANHRSHHISEMTVTDNSGKRMVYGIPVYNYSQDEYTFAVGRTSPDPSGSNLVDVPAGITDPANLDRGIDHYYHKESKPAYATSFLLTSILSPDYQDKTGDGITDDDQGTALKMNYSKLPYAYKWRAPYQKATLNKGLLADPDDDKGSIIYGEKEIWYVSSMESKTKIAYFITQDRADGLGVTDWLNGGRDETNRQKCLKEIRLYSKADMTKPIKVVKFEYAYSLCKNVPNSSDLAQGGKLTLSKVWFEYGNSDKGKFHPYTFTYNQASDANPDGSYQYMAADRWGNYKSPGQNTGGMDNEQYPYASQDKASADQNAGLWNLSKIALPTGGVIDVAYEAGDYAYVQDKKAMAMTGIRSLISNPGSADNPSLPLSGARGIRVNIGTDVQPPVAVQTAWFKNKFLNGSDYIYTKMYVKLSTPNSDSGGADYDFVPVYCKISSVSVSNGMANIMLADLTESKVVSNPVSIAAWQRQKNEYPRYAYPGFDNRVQQESSSVSDAVSAIVNAAKNLSELKKNYYQKAKEKGYAAEVNLARSFVKLALQGGRKLGGNARVRSVRISDSWDEMSGGSTAPPGAYGQAYDYTTTENGQRVSSGVATYEPAVGNDENALKQPVPYVQKIKGAINNYFSLEEPFGESLYPAPAVGYSKVTVRDLDKDHNPSEKTGYLVNEFYTAKDFPVKVTVLPLISLPYKPASYYSLTGSNSIDELTLSQGYSIELNDMHGKTKATRIFNQAGAEISSTAYYYNTADPAGSGPALDNHVDVIGQDGVRLKNQVIGRDIEFFTDFREQETKNNGRAINIGVDVIPFFPIFGLPFLPLPHFPIGGNNDYKLFRSACAVKVIQSYGIMSRVVKTENGSSVTTQNLAYDGLTGEALVTRTQNEFKNYIYSVNLPAYWMYKGMGAASQNAGLMYSQLQTDATGAVQGAYSNYLHSGDEFIDLTSTSGAHYWITEAATGYTTSIKRVIDRQGYIQKNFSPQLVKVIRSGYRNMLDASTSTITCLKYPFNDNGNLTFAFPADHTSWKVINAAATTYDEQWTPNAVCKTADLIENTTKCFMFCTGSPMAAYNSSGTRLQETTGGAYYNMSSVLWGGVACGQNQNARIRSFAARDTTATSDRTAADTSSGTTKSKTFSARTLVSVSPTQTIPACQRSDYSTSTSGFSCWPLHRSGIWLCQGFGPGGTGFDSGFDETIGFDTCITVPASKTYYFGYGGDNSISLSIDGGQVASDASSNAYNYWTIVPYYVPAGKHVLHVEFYNHYISGADNSNNPAIAGVEIYNNTAAELKNAQSETSLNRLFTTAGVRGKNIKSFRTVPATSRGTKKLYHYALADGTTLDACTPAPRTSSLIVNPFLNGFLGNWRPYQSLVYQSTRKYNQKTNVPQKGMDLQNAGYINTFSSYWYYNGSTWVATSGASAQWRISNTITLYDKYGQQLENRDALGRYSAAKFDFNGELPAAVASNAYYRDIYVNSLEDSRFKPGAADTLNCNRREFVQPSTGLGISSMATTAFSHSGNYSALLPNDGLTLSTVLQITTSKTYSYVSLDANNQYTTTSTQGVYPNGFEPGGAAKYIFNVWVKDGHAGDKSVNVLLLGNNNSNIALRCKAVVEDWKLLEGTIDLSTTQTGAAINLSIVPANGSVVYIDDIRIHPSDSQLKSYVYDEKTMRLMAEIDENGFATFYEYDDEGLLVRVKKETERGTMTLKESRSSYKHTSR